MVKKSYWSQPLALPPKHPRVRVYRAESGVEQLGRADSNIPAPNMTTGSGRTGDDAKYRSRSSWSNPIRRVSGKTDELPTSRICHGNFIPLHPIPWNKGKLVGQKAPLKLKDTWAIRVRLQLRHKLRDLALFNLAIDSKLRACDLIALRVTDIARSEEQTSELQSLMRISYAVFCWKKNNKRT